MRCIYSEAIDCSECGNSRCPYIEYPDIDHGEEDMQPDIGHGEEDMQTNYSDTFRVLFE